MREDFYNSLLEDTCSVENRIYFKPVRYIFCLGLNHRKWVCVCVKGLVLKYISLRIFMVTKTTSLVGAFVIVFEFITLFFKIYSRVGEKISTSGVGKVSVNKKHIRPQAFFYFTEPSLNRLIPPVLETSFISRFRSIV